MVRDQPRPEVHAHGRSGLNVWVPVADEGTAVRRLLGAGWAVLPGERFRLRSGPGIRVTVSTLEVAEAAVAGGDLSARKLLPGFFHLDQAGLMPETPQPDGDATETAVRVNPRLTQSQKRALLAVYRTYLEANGYGPAADVAEEHGAAEVPQR